MRRLVATLWLIACFLGIWTASRTGLSRHYSDNGLAFTQVATTAEALRLAPNDPVAHYAHAIVLAKMGHTAEAIAHLKNATALRPQDYLLWSELGRTLRQSGDKEGAVVAFREAVRHAEYYAQPRWDLGNLLLELARQDEAFTELSRAGASDPNLFLELVKLAWKYMPGNPAGIVQATQPQTSEAQMQLARFFVWRGLADEAMALFRETDEISPRDRDELVADLIAAKWFPQAHEVWSKGRKAGIQRTEALIEDAGFERGAEAFSSSGFSWNIPREVSGLRLSFDKLEAQEGEQSLKVEWKGITNAAVPALSQLVLTEPATRYRLSYAARSSELVSGTPPFIGVLEAGADDKTFLTRSVTFSTGTSPWQDYTFEFFTPKETRAVRIVIQRPKCHEAPCPIFGRLWLDSFSLTKLETR